MVIAKKSYNNCGHEKPGKTPWKTAKGHCHGIKCHLWFLLIVDILFSAKPYSQGRKILIGSSQMSDCNSVSNWCSVLRGCDKTYLDVFPYTNVFSANRTPRASQEWKRSCLHYACTVHRDISQTKEVPHFFKNWS